MLQDHLRPNTSSSSAVMRVGGRAHGFHRNHTEAKAAGVKSVPALVLEGLPFHINFGAGLDALK